MTSNLAHLLRDRAQQLESKRAFSFLHTPDSAETSITYERLHQRARAIGGELQDRIAAGERALLLYPPELEFIPAFFGCLYAGLVAVPVSPVYNKRSRSLRGIVRSARPALVLSTAGHIERSENLYADLPELLELPWVATDSVADDRGEDWTDPGLSSSRLALLQFTSGSTSEPRGVMLTHENVLQNSAQIQRSFGVTRETKSVFWLPLHHDMGLIGGVVQPLYAGAFNTLMPARNFLHRPLAWLETISRTGASISGGPNFAYDLCARKASEADLESLDLSCWDVAFVGAEPIRAQTMERFAATFASSGFRAESFLPCYGLAEATLIVSGGPRRTGTTVVDADAESLACNVFEDATGGPETPRRLVAAGEVLSGQDLEIVDPVTAVRCEDGAIGEIWLRGPSVAAGYFESSEATDATFRARLADTGAGPFLRTGDLGVCREGKLIVTGRLKDVIIIRGRNHYPQDFEEVVEAAHHAFRAGHCAAFSVNAEDDERLVIVQEIEPRHRDLDHDEALRAIRHCMAEHFDLQPYGIVLARAGAVSKTTSGKIRRSECRGRYLRRELPVIASWQATPADGAPARREPRAEAVKPAEAIEAWLTEQVATRLSLEPGLGLATTPFSELGMGSLEAVQMAADLERWLGRGVSPTAIYNHPTISALARWLADSPPAPPEAAPNAKPRGAQDSARSFFGELRQLSEQDVEALISLEMASRQSNE